MGSALPAVSPTWGLEVSKRLELCDICAMRECEIHGEITSRDEPRRFDVTEPRAGLIYPVYNPVYTRLVRLVGQP